MKIFKNKKLITVCLTSALMFSLIIVSACAQSNKIQEGVFPNTTAENAQIAEKYKATAEEMSEFTIKEFSENISKIPRESGHVDQINEYVYNWGISHNIKTTKDQSGCIYYDVPATDGCETYPTIILQAHTDMVQTTADESINMNNSPIDIVLNEETKALESRDNKTNIGADDAEGIAALMNFAINKNYKHGPLRMLFTYDEETTMEGAVRLSPEVLNSDYLINIDSGPVGSACVSSAGVLKVGITKQYKTLPTGFNTKLKIEIKDLLGGHSGVEIAKKRINANACVAQVLQKLLDENINFEVASANGGEGMNIIATRAEVEIMLNSDDAERAKTIINDEFAAQKKTNTEDKNGKIEITEEQALGALTLNQNDTKNLIGLLNKMPHGCRETSSEFEGVPVVSSNFGLLSMNNGELNINVHSRSNISGKNEALDSEFQQTAKDFGANYEILGTYLP